MPKTSAFSKFRTSSSIPSSKAHFVARSIDLKSICKVANYLVAQQNREIYLPGRISAQNLQSQKLQKFAHSSTKTEKDAQIA